MGTPGTWAGMTAGTLAAALVVNLMPGLLPGRLAVVVPTRRLAVLGASPGETTLVPEAPVSGAPEQSPSRPAPTISRCRDKLSWPLARHAPLGRDRRLFATVLPRPPAVAVVIGQAPGNDNPDRPAVSRQTLALPRSRTASPRGAQFPVRGERARRVGWHARFEQVRKSFRAPAVVAVSADN